MTESATQRAGPAMEAVSAGMTFSKFVRNLLQFKRTLQRNRVVVLTPKEQKPGSVRIFASQFFDRIGLLKNLPRKFGHALHRRNDFDSLRARQMPNPAEQKCQQRQNDDLRAKTLGRSHADLRTGMHIDTSHRSHGQWCCRHYYKFPASDTLCVCSPAAQPTYRLSRRFDSQ